ncbi:IS200/IS605 family accessory protein TnpB-related protein [Natranaerofaba carboxydovora]|uniref:IS200/IS605 family accessory protein TnpB-related protein n=1 Tax=Natranaerofaba carboxydovora TaxID=2742683 RepID=UPI001F129159|nr:IS200/IS605 family accessory protein TnpB-related protein [Natranaerofaba carboxydovora]UMZ74158.1 hypothetical protein ACONDI_01738 [Natranaerofaba carboxydovora]
MKTTRMLKLKNISPQFKVRLDNLMREFCAAKRYSYNRLINGLDQNETNKLLQRVFRLNKRYSEDATLQAKTIIDSQKELLALYLEETKAKLIKTRRKIETYKTGKKTPQKVDLKTCLEGLGFRVKKLEQKQTELQNHIDNHTIPPAIFGGKKNFRARTKGHITNQEWKDLRTNQLYSRGDKTKKGNLNTRITEQNDRFYLEIADSLNIKPNNRSPRIKAELEIPDKYFDEILDATYPDSKGNYHPYSIEIKRKDGEYYVYLTYEEEVPGSWLKPKQPINVQLIAGIDVNIDRTAVTIMTKQGNFIKSRVFYCHEMEYVSSNKRENIAGEHSKDIIDYLLHENVGAIVTEKLNFRNDHDTNKRYNRLTHNFTRKKLLQGITRRGLRNGFEIKQINPAYSSIIGRFKYSKKYSLSVHQAAALVIGRRGLGYREKLPVELIQKLQELKPYLQNLIGSKEESNKIKYLKDIIQKIDNFKNYHHWTLWNMANKFLEFNLSDHKLKRQEVKPLSY